MIKTDTVTGYLQAAIKAAEMRQGVIAENIANVSTPGYRPKLVQFEQYLLKALESAEPVRPDQLRPRIVLSRDASAGVSLERQIGDLIRNTAMSKTYMRLLGKLYSQMELAMQV